MSGRLRVALALVLAATLAAPASALAHAQLEGTSPERDAVVARAPALVAFQFSEPVEGQFGAVRVFDSAGRRVESGGSFHPGGDSTRLGTHLRSGLATGTYTATYRVVSEDGHIVSGGFAFSIGHASTTHETVGGLLAGSKAGPVTGTAFTIARAVQYAAIAAGTGLLVFLLAVWWPALTGLAGAEERWREASEAFAARALRVLGTTALVGAVSALVAIVLEGATAGGVTAWSALRANVLQDVVQTRFGAIWEIGLLAWMAVGAGVLLLAAANPARLPVLRHAYLGPIGLAPSPLSLGAVVLLAVPLAYLVTLPALGGHGATQQPIGVELPANVLHVLAVSVWTGGLLALVVVLPAATHLLAREDRTRLLAGAVARFSPLALAAVAVIVLTGIAQSLVLVRTPAHLVDTGFGRLVLIKAVLLTVLIALGAAQRYRNVPRIRRLAREGAVSGEAGVVLRRTLLAELGLVVAVLAVTGILSGAAPSTAAPTGPFNGSATVGGSDLQVTVSPARVGPNSVHLYLIDARTGRNVTSAKEVDVAESLPGKGIGTIKQVAQRAGPGHYVAPGVVLGLPGDWRLEVTVRTSEFDESTATLTVPVR